LLATGSKLIVRIKLPETVKSTYNLEVPNKGRLVFKSKLSIYLR